MCFSCQSNNSLVIRWRQFYMLHMYIFKKVVIFFYIMFTSHILFAFVDKFGVFFIFQNIVGRFYCNNICEFKPNSQIHKRLLSFKFEHEFFLEIILYRKLTNFFVLKWHEYIYNTCSNKQKHSHHYS